MKLNKRFRTVLVVVAAIVVVFSLILTVANGTVAWLPTWHDLFAVSGFSVPSVPKDELRMTVFNVGNADCILIQTGKYAALVDAGSVYYKQELLRALKERGIKRIDYLVATHADIDHIGCMPAVIEQMEIGMFLMPSLSYEYQPSTHTFVALQEAAKAKELSITAATYGTVCRMGEAELTIISGLGSTVFDNPNAQSVICKLTFGEHALLLMGDANTNAEAELLANSIDVRADVIKIGHHGSNHSSGKAFLNAVAPRYAIITSGFNNPNGHPHDRVLADLQSIGATVYRSDLNGTIEVTCRGDELFIASER